MLIFLKYALTGLTTMTINIKWTKKKHWHHEDVCSKCSAGKLPS